MLEKRKFASDSSISIDWCFEFIPDLKKINNEPCSESIEHMQSVLQVI